MGVVEDVRVDGAHVEVDLVLDHRLVPVRGVDVDRHPGGADARSTASTRVDVKVVWEPVWTPDRLSESARAKLRMPLEELSPTASGASPQREEPDHGHHRHRRRRHGARERKVDAFVFDCVCHIFNFDPANALGAARARCSTSTSTPSTSC